MSATAAPFGFRPARGRWNHQALANPYTIASAYATAIGEGDAVILNTNGTITAGTTNADIIGIFKGVEYDDADGKRVFKKNWVASTVATNIVAYVYDDPGTLFEVQCSGSLALTSVGDQADLVAGTVNAQTGVSAQALNSTLAGAGSQKQFRIVELAPYPDNDWGDSFTVVRVMIARHQYVAVKVAI
jgi:hypothetical protein